MFVGRPMFTKYFKVVFFGFYLIVFAETVLASTEKKLLVDIPWLVQHEHEKGYVVVDVRSTDEYGNGHIPGAVNIPVSVTFNPKRNTDRVASTSHVKTVFSEVGITNDDIVVIYDDGRYIDAGRVFWVFEVFGHKQVKLLNGGYSAWKNKKQPVSKTEPTIKKSNYIPNLEPNRLTTKFSMQMAIKGDNQIIIDARSADEFNGIKSIAVRSGHIPNAKSIPWTNNFTEINGVKYLKPLSELKAVYGNVDQEKKIYLYCNKGKQSSLSYMVMRQLGYDASHYDGSWYEWGNDASLPINLK